MSETGRAPCQIYLMVDGGHEPGVLAAALDTGVAACVLLRDAPGAEDDPRAAAEPLRTVAHARGIAFLIENRPDLAAELACDGVHLPAGARAVEAARRRLGAEAIVGAGCDASRHAALEAAEAGADYVAFGGGAHGERPEDVADPELLAWWQELMTVPCVAMGGVDLGNAAALAAAGADFLAVGDGVWGHHEGPVAALRLLRERIEGT